MTINLPNEYLYIGQEHPWLRNTVGSVKIVTKGDSIVVIFTPIEGKLKEEEVRVKLKNLEKVVN